MDQRKTADFVDELMERAFSLPAPEMPDFASISKEESPLQELKDEELYQGENPYFHPQVFPAVMSCGGNMKKSGIEAKPAFRRAFCRVFSCFSGVPPLHFPDGSAGILQPYSVHFS